MEPYISEIKMFSFSFAPPGWSHCDGQIISTEQNNALYALIQNYFGGDGEKSFALPDLRGRVPVGYWGQYNLGEKAGLENVTLTEAEMPAHSHTVAATSASASDSKLYANAVFSQAKDVATGLPTSLYSYGNQSTAVLHPDTVNQVGGGLSHSNLQPSIVVNFCMAITGTFPSRN